MKYSDDRRMVDPLDKDKPEGTVDMIPVGRNTPESESTQADKPKDPRKNIGETKEDDADAMFNAKGSYDRIKPWERSAPFKPFTEEDKDKMPAEKVAEVENRLDKDKKDKK